MIRVVILCSICIFMGVGNASYAKPLGEVDKALTSKVANQLARQVVDQLMNIENDKVAQTLIQLEQAFPDYSLLGFMKITPLWAKAESTYDEATRLKCLHAVIAQLTKNIQLAQSEISKHPDSTDWQLSLGLSQAFAGLAYMRLGEWLKAYRAGRAGRDTLRMLLQKHPEIEDAYFVLGFYEYYTGKVPLYLAWLTWLVDLSGDRELGLKYIHRAIDHAPIFSPEASRLLLVQTKTTKKNACPKKMLAHDMTKRYPNNEQFPWLEKRFNNICLSRSTQR